MQQDRLPPSFPTEQQKRSAAEQPKLSPNRYQTYSPPPPPAPEPRTQYIYLVPGVSVVQIPSSFSDPLVKKLSSRVLQVAVVLFFLQVARIIVFYLAFYQKDDVLFWVNFGISVFITLLVFICAYVGVVYKNPPCCGPTRCVGCRYLDFYYAWCIVGSIFSFVYTLLALFTLNWFSFAFNAVQLILYLIGGKYTQELLVMLAIVSAENNECHRGAADV
jgi:hypothetical protein